MLKILFLIPAIILNISSQEIEKLPEDLKLMSKKGIDYIYAVEPEKAEEQFREVINKYPNHPFGHFGIAMAKWAYFEYLEDESDPSLDKEYYDLTEKAINVGENWIKEHKRDPNAYMCLGGIYGLRARLYLMQHRWLKAYIYGKKAVSNMRKSIEIDPEMYDSYLGLGMYEYSAATLPTVIRWLAKLLISGDANKGIEYLKICKEKGYFNSIAAELILIEIFTQTNSPYANPELAVKWAKELREQYPYHAQMHFVEIVSLFEAKKYDEAKKEMFEYLNRIGKYPHYRKRYLSRIYVSLGTIFMVERNYDKAEYYFTKAKETIDTEKHPNRWAIWGIVRLGNLYDIIHLREKAIEKYKEALSYKDNWGFKEYIEEYIKTPFSVNFLPGQLPPP